MRLFFYLFLSLCFISCKQSQKKKQQINDLKTVVNNTISTTLQLPKALKVYAPFQNYLKDSLAISNADFKIYTAVDASCGACIKKIRKWATLAEELKSANVAIILLCHGEHGRFVLLEHLCETEKLITFPYPFFLDLEGSYTDNNAFMDKNASFETVLTDKTNRILALGNPIYSEGIKALFLKMVGL